MVKQFLDSQGDKEEWFFSVWGALRPRQLEELGRLLSWLERVPSLCAERMDSMAGRLKTGQRLLEVGILNNHEE
ncbi:hypothetical protein Dimus_030830, partial [Dionaea muscipula]